MWYYRFLLFSEIFEYSHFHTWYVEQITIKGEEFLMVKPLFSATHFRRNLISHGCHIVLKLQHYRVSRRKNSSHYLKVMVINMSNWFVTRIWSMASNKKKILLNSILKQRWTSIFTYAVILWKKTFFLSKYSIRTSCTPLYTLCQNSIFCPKK